MICPDGGFLSKRCFREWRLSGRNFFRFAPKPKSWPADSYVVADLKRNMLLVVFVCIRQWARWTCNVTVFVSFCNSSRPLKAFDRWKMIHWAVINFPRLFWLDRIILPSYILRIIISHKDPQEPARIQWFMSRLWVWSLLIPFLILAYLSAFMSAFQGRVYCLKDYPRKYLATKVIVSPQDLGGKHLAGRPYTQSTDLWSLGVVLYELLLGALSGVEIRTWKGHFLQTFRNILGGIKHMLANVWWFSGIFFMIVQQILQPA